MNTVSRTLLDMVDNTALPITEPQKKALHDAAWVCDYAQHASTESWKVAVGKIEEMQNRLAWSEANLAVTTKEE